MTVPPAGDRYGTRWRVVALVLAPCLAVVLALGSAMASGALALSFVAQSGTLGLATEGLAGEDFGIAVVTVPTHTEDGPAEVTNARIGVGKGRINGLCIAQPVDLLGKAFTLFIRGGDDDASTFEIAADALILDVTEARGVIENRGELAVNKNAADVLWAPRWTSAGSRTGSGCRPQGPGCGTSSRPCARSRSRTC